ncbi:carbohydrate kinase family protein [Patescibacteria group bacterium]|nr:carbohydrate kinase family protein [Patescibacteria group bacterium]
MDILVTGTLGYDYIMNFAGRFSDRIMADKIHSISLSFLVDRLNKQFGGTAGNIAYSLKLLGMNPVILAPAGNDFGDYKSFLEHHGIRTATIPVHKNLGTGAYFVVTDKEDNQIGTFYTGANRYAAKLSLAPYGGKDMFVVIAPTDPSAMKKYVGECSTLKLPYLYDPAFQIGTFSPQELQQGIRGAEIVIGNDYEIELMQEKLHVSHDELRTMVPILITTLGSRGSVIETRRDAIHIRPAKPLSVLDPTGAGDAFRGGFLAGYVRYRNGASAKENQGLTPEELAVCGQMGAVAAVYTVEKYGTVTHSYTKVQFIKRYKENYGEVISMDSLRT